MNTYHELRELIYRLEAAEKAEHYEECVRLKILIDAQLTANTAALNTAALTGQKRPVYDDDPEKFLEEVQQTPLLAEDLRWLPVGIIIGIVLTLLALHKFYLP